MKFYHDKKIFLHVKKSFYTTLVCIYSRESYALGGPVLTLFVLFFHMELLKLKILKMVIYLKLMDKN